LNSRHAVTILYDWFLPAFKAGGPIQSIKNIAEHLQNDIDISIVCSNVEYDKTVLAVQPNQWTTRENYRVYYTDQNFYRIIKAIQQQDVLYVNGVYSFQYNLLPLLRFKGRKIVAARGMLDPGGLLQKLFKKKIYLKFWKLAGLHRKCEYHASSEIEKHNIQSVLGKDTKVWVIQNLPKTITYKELPYKNRDSITLCTIALISPMKNHLLVLRSLLHCSTDVVYNIYGPIKDKAYWRSCEKVIGELPQNIKVIYHGVISPASIPEALAECHVYVQPSKSENFSHSLVDAFMTGRPVITSCFTPWNNLADEYAGVNVSIDDTEEMTKAIDQFVAMDAIEFQQWSKGASDYVSKSIDIEIIKKQYIDMFTAKPLNQ
jgi:glycosyltransferase involved in cell wall biosynthesis